MRRADTEAKVQTKASKVAAADQNSDHNGSLDRSSGVSGGPRNSDGNQRIYTHCDEDSAKIEDMRLLLCVKHDIASRSHLKFPVNPDLGQSLKKNYGCTSDDEGSPQFKLVRKDSDGYSADASNEIWWDRKKLSTSSAVSEFFDL
jgi:hypothetical protein